MNSVHGQVPELKTKHRIYIATPCYGGMLSISYFMSILKLIDLLKSKDISINLNLRGNESLINRARNGYVADFLGQEDCDYLLFIDADIGFQPEVILTMLDYDKPVVAAAVPMKGLNWDAIFTNRHQFKSAADMEKLAAIYNINHGVEDGLKYVVDEKGFAKVEMIGAAVMLIKREVFDIMRAKLPDQQYVNDISGYDKPNTKGNFWLFFETMRHPVSNRYLSEDFAFCYRWRHYCGGDIYAYVNAEITHSGTYQFKGGPPTGSS